MAQPVATTKDELKHQDLDTLQPHILELCKNALWPDHDPAVVLMKELQGDDEYRAIGIIGKEDDGTRNDYVLHIPTSDDDIVKEDVALLRFIKANTTIPVPQVATLDAGKDNPIGCPYAFYNRVMGDNLLDAWPRLTPTQQRSVAEQLGLACREMLYIKNSMPGELTSVDGEGLSIVPYLGGPASDAGVSPSPYDCSLPTRSVRDWLTSRFTALKERLIEVAPDSSAEEQALIDRFMQMAADLDEGGYLHDSYYCLTLWHFQPTNMAVNASSDGLSAEIVIINWESASITPVITTCNPPSWLWQWNGEDENSELKSVFEKAAGPEYKKWADGDVNWLARVLIAFAVDLKFFGDHLESGRNLADEWDAWYKG